MTTENLTPNVLLAILKKNGYETTKASIARYMQDGLVMRPLQRKKRIDNEERAYYHPLVIIEIMTAILLFRGDFLEYGSRRRIARLTARDLFYGRLSCYLIFFDNNDININDFYTDISNRPYPFFKNPKKLYMNAGYVSQYRSLVSSTFSSFFGTTLSDTYRSFASSIYIETFNYLFQKHKEILRNLDSYILDLYSE